MWGQKKGTRRVPTRALPIRSYSASPRSSGAEGAMPKNFGDGAPCAGWAPPSRAATSAVAAAATAARATPRRPCSREASLMATRPSLAGALAADAGCRGPRKLVAEVPAAREDHRRVRVVHGGDHLAVALRPAGLDERPHTR